MLKLERGRKAKPSHHHPIARTLQVFAGASQRRTRTATTGLNSIWSAQFGATPVFGIHVSDFDPK